MSMHRFGVWKFGQAAILGLFVLAVSVRPAFALSVAELSHQDTVQALREALVQASSKAVSVLGRPDGFLANPKVKIPLPQSLQRIEGAMRTVGMGKQADELITTMNRAAENAVPQAKALLIDSVKRMSVQDARSVLTGGERAATDYFRKTTSGPLTEKFLPIVREATSRVRLAETYNSLAGKAAGFGLIEQKDANLDSYIAQRALDGLFLMMAEEEKAIRQNPIGAATSMVKKVFGAIGR
jgi:Protein of unknown function (DUF4197)